MASLLGAVIGGGAVLIAQHIANDAQLEQQREQFAREQESAARNQRLPIYEEFLAAANAFAADSQLAYECEVAQAEPCEISPDELQSVRYRYQVAVNKMHVYGSPLAVGAVILVSQPLPPSLIGLTGDAVVEPIDNEAFRSAFQLFTDVMCRDLAEDPTHCPDVSRDVLDQINQLNEGGNQNAG